MMLLLWLDNKKISVLMYCIMVVVAFLVRDMLTTPLWMTCAIIGACILGVDTEDTEEIEELEYSDQIITDNYYNTQSIN